LYNLKFQYVIFSKSKTFPVKSRIHLCPSFSVQSYYADISDVISEFQQITIDILQECHHIFMENQYTISDC